MNSVWFDLPLAADITSLGKFNPLAIAFFFVFVASSLGITYWAAKLTKNTAHFYTAGGKISGFQNGLALAGDFMSAASFLGIAGLVALNGFDGLIYSIGFLVGWPIVMFLILGILFKGQNVAYMVGLAFVIAASANFPALLLSMLWRRFTTNGAVASMLVGTFSSLLLIYLSPTIQVTILKHASAPFGLKNPGLVTIPLSFLVAIVVSLLTTEQQAQEKFAEVEVRIHIGSGM
ncbi:MAG: hypothetical protein V7K21_10775 [Nostoc sp.]|uniref:sodium:solute symporter family transporter n=1 Tax=Nostoc sp. TaxID=1180 RepID=UPI002FF5CA05